jgi:hypothetical protein
MAFRVESLSGATGGTGTKYEGLAHCAGELAAVQIVTQFDEYRMFSENVQRLSERRQSASQIYLTVNTASFGVLAFLVNDAGFSGWGLVAASVPLFVVGIMACAVWYRIIVQFRAVIGWHYEQLRAMEAVLEGSARVYTKEWERFYKPLKGSSGKSSKAQERYGFSRLEAWLPRLLIALYAIYAVGLVVAAIVGWV